MDTPEWAKELARHIFTAETKAKGGMMKGGYGFLSLKLKEEYERSAIRAVMGHQETAPMPHVNGWDAHTEFRRSALAARQAFDHVVGKPEEYGTVSKHEARNLAHLKKVYQASREKFPEFADTLAWLLWWDIATFDRFAALTEPAQSPQQILIGCEDGDIPCDRCSGTGNLIKDWDRYVSAKTTEEIEDCESDCPDCSGYGRFKAETCDSTN